MTRDGRQRSRARRFILAGVPPTPPQPAPATTNRRAELLDIAADLFARSGYTRTSLRDVADTAGILAGSLYHHFPSKEALAVELVEAFHRELDEVARNPAPRPTGPLDALQEFAQAVASVAERHRAAVHLCRYDAPTTATEALSTLVRHEPPSLDLRWASLVDLARDHLRPEVDPELLRTVLRRSVIDLGSLPAVQPPREVVGALTELVRRGLATGAPSAADLDSSTAAEVAGRITDGWSALAEVVPVGRREQILVAARAEFARRGFEATTVRDIADTAQIRGSSLYRHVSSKQALLTEIMDLFSSRLLAGFEAVGQAGGTATERLDAILILMASAAGPFWREFVITQAWWRTVDAAAPDPALKQNAARLALLRDLLADGIATGEFRTPQHPKLLALVLRNIMWIPLGRPMLSPSRHHEFLRTCLLHGAAAPSRLPGRPLH